MNPQHTACRRGFTLIEVLVALAIVAAGMAAVLGALTSSADTVSYLRDKTFANYVALNQIATLRLSGQSPTSGDTEGDSDMAGRKWHWHQTVSATQVPGMVRIDVSVRPADVQSSSDDRGWYTTMSGMWGDAVGQPRGDLPDWGEQLLTPGSNAAGGTPGTTPGTTAPGTTPSTSPVVPPAAQPVRQPTLGVQ
jgi:general secretion pathway protein I